MLTREIMGAVALWILWVNTLLIAADAGLELRSLLTLRRALSRGEDDGEDRRTGERLVRAILLRGDGPEGAAALLRIEQVGRFGAERRGPRVILFSDRAAKAEAFGGVARLEGGAELTIDASTDVELWLEPEELARAAACPSNDGFDAAYEEARKARGHARTVCAALAGEREIFLFGALARRDEGRARLHLSTPKHGPMLIATFDPRAWLAKKAWLVAAFIVGELVTAAGLSALALWPPRFGLISSAGGFLALLFFLTVQPAGVALREAVRVPSRAFLRGRWVRGAPATNEALEADRETASA